jgi:integrase/recombinase XerD
MRNRNEPTVVAKATQCIYGYEKVYKKLQQQVTLRGQSRSTLENYIRRIAQISLYFGKLPDLLHIPDKLTTFNRTKLTTSKLLFS